MDLTPRSKARGWHSYPEIERAGRFVYWVKIRSEFGSTGMGTVGFPALVLGARWARWKARRMLRAAIRAGDS